MTTTHQNLSGRLRTETTNPSTPEEGDMYYNSTDNTWMRYNGTDWIGVRMTTSSTTTTSTSTTTS
jgi:hypothetical protein